MTKLCKKTEKVGCGRVLDVCLFYKNGSYIHSYCKSCMIVYQELRKIRKKNKAEVAREMCNQLIKEMK